MNSESDTFSSTVDIEDNIQNIAETSSKPSIFNIKNILLVSSALAVILFGYLAIRNGSVVNTFSEQGQTNETPIVGHHSNDVKSGHPKGIDFKTNIVKVSSESEEEDNLNITMKDNEFIIFLHNSKILKVNPLTLEGKYFSFLQDGKGIKELAVSDDKKTIYFQICDDSRKIFMLDVDSEVNNNLSAMQYLLLSANSFCLGTNELYFVDREKSLKIYEIDGKKQFKNSNFFFNSQPKLYFISKDKTTLFYDYNQTRNTIVYMKNILTKGAGEVVFSLSENGGFIPYPKNPNLIIAIGILSTNDNRNEIVIFDLKSKTEFKPVPINIKIGKVIKLEFSNDGEILYIIHSVKSYVDDNLIENIGLVKINYEELLNFENDQNPVNYGFIKSNNNIEFKAVE